MDFWESLVRMVSALAAVLGLMMVLALAARRWLGGRVLVGADTPLVQVLGTGYLGPKKSVALVSVAGELLIVGSTADGLVPLGRVNDPEQVRQVLAKRDAGTALPEVSR
ncbi:MAG: flagellar biosynthetic protein FliO [Nitrospirota bacterium]|nr:flagellar biosynthetic protein FliO [Nitrospirota bacterium]